MNVLVTGASGQLGSEIASISSLFPKINFFFANSKLIDICNFNELESYVNQNNIDAIINCAAYTQVDKAEDEIELAEKVNTFGVANLVRVIENTKKKLIHVSTDYVFDGKIYIPYKESDATNPLGVYGRTKLKGEEIIIDSDVNAIIIRTSWLYSEFGSNFVKTMLRLGNDRETLGVIADQVGTPTNAKDLAFACLEILFKKDLLNKNGTVYHYSNEGAATWYDFATAIMELSKTDCVVLPIETKDYPTLAVRPQYSILNKSKIKNDFNLSILNWRASLSKCIKKIEGK